MRFFSFDHWNLASNNFCKNTLLNTLIWKYENLECNYCKKEDEAQKDILECNEISKFKENKNETIEYEYIFRENEKCKLKIARMFIENLKIREKLDDK